jgi:peptide/nickel transport system substrate-binding protein
MQNDRLVILQLDAGGMLGLAIQEILNEEQPYCFLFVPYALPIVQRRFEGIQPALAGIMYNFEKWFVPKALQRHEVVK